MEKKPVKQAAKRPSAKSPARVKATQLPSTGASTNSQPQATARPSPVVSERHLSATPARVPITFALPDLGAQRVALSGDFNNWSPDVTLMNRHEGGHWETTLDLPPGRYHYKFIVDGQWIPDPLAEENVLNTHGTLNSVIEVSP